MEYILYMFRIFFLYQIIHLGDEMKKNKNEKKDERRLINKEINMNVTLVLYLRHLGIIFDSQRERKILFNI